MPAAIELVATDLDGTLIGSANELPFYTEFNERIESLRARRQASWAACTGRTFSSFWEFFMPMRRMGILPDYVIIRHAFIYRLTRFGFLPHLRWNIKIVLRLWREGLAAGEAIDQWHETLTGGATGVQTIRREKHRLCIRFNSEDAARVAFDMLLERVRPFRNLRVFLEGREVDVRTIPASKGLALAELAKHLGVAREGILAIGNGYNDLSMLDGATAGLVGCPSNSVAEVIECVHRAGGHVAGKRALLGVMEVLDAFINGDVCSDLPDNFHAGEKRERTTSRKRQKHGAARQHRAKTHPLLFIGIAYAGLLVFASFDILPFSRIVRMPVDLLIRIVSSVFDAF